jgi:hypothetical protein
MGRSSTPTDRIVNSPKEHGSQTTVEERADPANGGDGSIRVTKRITVSKIYDLNGFLTQQITETVEAENTSGARFGAPPRRPTFRLSARRHAPISAPSSALAASNSAKRIVVTSSGSWLRPTLPS